MQHQQSDLSKHALEFEAAQAYLNQGVIIDLWQFQHLLKRAACRVQMLLELHRYP
jgi:hypothetical protein